MESYTDLQMEYIHSVGGQAHQSAVDIIGRLEYALDQHEKYNFVRNDLEAYLLAVIEYARGKKQEKPNEKDFGL